MNTVNESFETAIACYHCGEDIVNEDIIENEKHFCCTGCKTVYDIINKNNLCEYYDISSSPGINQKNKIRKGKFDFLDDVNVTNKFVHFKNDIASHVIFNLPQMHCSSCIWILENLNKIENAIIKSQVNFIKKEVTIVYDYHKISLKKVAEILTLIGYEPHISLNDLKTNKIKKYDTSQIIKLGIAGFCFGNVMMLSFPEYFSLGEIENENLKKYFGYWNLLLSLPVFFYSASEFFISGYKGLRQKFLNIDAPIALAILLAFVRSVYEILSDTGAGYLDSMCGIVFFMLVGRYFQNRTYQNISFDRDFTSYFPLGVSVINEKGEETQIPVSDLKVGDRIKIHNDEIIPADAILFLGKATIDYSFVTGESAPIDKSIGEILYAGGKQTSGAIELEVIKEVSQSYLTQLWNNDVFSKKKEITKTSFVHRISKYFTLVLFIIAGITATYWAVYDPSKIWNSVTALLIVACPCALLLSATFTNGNIIRVLNKYKLFVKNASVIERMGKIDTIVFDKTGTITEQGKSEIIYQGIELTESEQQMLRSLASHSNHPLSKGIVSYLPFYKSLLVKNYKEIKGEGACGEINGNKVIIGTSEFVINKKIPHNGSGSRVFVSINNEYKGFFVLKSKYRKGLNQIINSLKQNFSLNILSGDNSSEKEYLHTIFGNDTTMFFEQKPEDKLNYIKNIQENHQIVLMIGDGLNDAGALKQSDVGISISDNINNFSPSCDAVLAGQSFYLLKEIIDFSRKQRTIIYASFVLSILYNIIGVYYSVQGILEPVVAAILMPISSVSIVLLTTGLSMIFERNLKLKIKTSDKSHNRV
jgi:Cu+-exporting ATPase